MTFLALPKPRAPAYLLAAMLFGESRLLREEEPRQMEASEAERADAHQLAASWSFTGASGTSGNI